MPTRGLEIEIEASREWESGFLMSILEIEGQDFEAKKSQIESLISYIYRFLIEY